MPHRLTRGLESRCTGLSHCQLSRAWPVPPRAAQPRSDPAGPDSVPEPRTPLASRRQRPVRPSPGGLRSWRVLDGAVRMVATGHKDSCLKGIEKGGKLSRS